MSASHSKKQRMVQTAIVVLAVVAAAGLAAYYAVQKRAEAKDVNATVSAVSRLVVLPADEQPSVTTVVDKSKVSQSFLQNAENGDQVLLYFQAGTAVVYRPSANKIVNMGPLETPKPRVFLRDGKPGDIPERLAEQIVSTREFTLVSRDTSAKQDYARTIIVDLTGNRPDVASRLAALIGAKVVELPEGEERPDADVMVIVGSDTE